MMDEMKTMPFGAIWDRLCDDDGIPRDGEWMNEVRAYERKVLSRRK